MKLKPIDLTKSLRPYKSGWVALSKDYKKVVFTGKTFLSLMKKVEKGKQKENVVLLPVIRNFRGFVA